jgi:hypothetical protein
MKRMHPQRQRGTQGKGAGTMLLKRHGIFRCALTVVVLLLLGGGRGLMGGGHSRYGLGPTEVLAESAEISSPCEDWGWSPADYGLKEHAVFWYDGAYYIASTHLTPNGREQKFAYASSTDLCNWTDLGGILRERTPGTWDEFRIWSPHVYYEDGTYYMFYTGVTNAFAQSIMLATSTDPSDPDSWERRGVVLQPEHPGSVWGGFNVWSDCRDPMVEKLGAEYVMYYTGRDTGGGIIGLATASSPLGPWEDQGAIAMSAESMPENATYIVYQGLYYLFYNDSQPPGLGQVYSYGSLVDGPWSEPRQFRPGWGHEVWLGQDGELYTSYLVGFDIAIRRLSWDHFFNPPRPFIGDSIYHVVTPLVLR